LVHKPSYINKLGASFGAIGELYKERRSNVSYRGFYTENITFCIFSVKKYTYPFKIFCHLRKKEVIYIFSSLLSSMYNTSKTF
jgi:hypothetical protein